MSEAGQHVTHFRVIFVNSLGTHLIRSIFVSLLALALLQSQPVKLNVANPDSILSRLVNRGFVEGTVTVEGTTIPLVRAVVTLSDQPADTPLDASVWAARYPTGKDGRYHFDLVPEGQYYLEVDCPGYFSFSELVRIDRNELQRVNIPLVPDYSHASIHTTGSLRIVATDKSTGEPIEGMTMFFKGERSSFETDQLGEMYIHHLRPGWYHLYISAEGYRDEIADSVRISAGSCSSFDAELRELVESRADLLCHEHHHQPYPITMIEPAQYGTLTGTIVDRDSMENVAFVQVYLAPFGMVSESDSTGTFTFRGLRPGTYCATIRLPGYERATVHEIDISSGQRKSIFIYLSRNRQSPPEEE